MWVFDIQYRKLENTIAATIHNQTVHILKLLVRYKFMVFAIIPYNDHPKMTIKAT